MATTTAVASKSGAGKAAQVDTTPKVMRQGALTPWLYLAPALIVMTVFIVYPLFRTIGLSLKDEDGIASAATTCREGRACWGVFENYRYALTGEMDLSSPGAIWTSFWASSYGNNVKWMLLLVTGTVGLGLLIALLADRVRYEALAKSIIFLPMAISFVGAGVIWKFMYAWQPAGQAQYGLVNAIWTGLGMEPIAILQVPGINVIALIVVGIWIWTGFCMTTLSAALKGVPTEIIEAARVDGATEWMIFSRILIPMISPTLVVIITFMVINVLKVFDIVYVMTGGEYGTEVIANRMYTEMYINYNTGRGTAIAVILVLVLIPFMIMNMRRFRQEEATR